MMTYLDIQVKDQLDYCGNMCFLRQGLDIFIF